MEAGAYAFRALRLVERGGGACRLAVSYVCVSFTFSRTALGFKPLAVGFVGLPRRNALQLSAVVHTQSDAHGRGSSLAVVAAETAAAPCLAADGSVVAPFGRKCAATVFFFMLGAWLGIGKRSFGWALWRLARPAGLLYVMWSVVEAGWGREFMPSVFHQLGIVLGAVCVMGLAARYVVHGGRQWKWLQASSFWIYATHVIVLGLTQTWLFRSYRPESDIELLLVFMAQIAWPVGAGAALYALMHKCLPRLTAWLTGGR